jgi:hypothetical protein
MRIPAQKQNQPQPRSRAATPAPEPRRHPLLPLQSAIGNQAVQRWLRSSGDPEQEADRVAEQVMHMPAPPARTPLPRPAGPAATPPIVTEVVRSPGQPLDPAARSFLEPRFGRDFRHVRIHTGAEAAESARAINARAYTVGHHVVLGPGQTGWPLLAHELTHVVQQAQAPGPHRAQLKKKAAPKQPFYQEALDKLEDTRKEDVIELSTGGQIDLFHRLPVVRKLIALEEAIDKEDLEAIPQLLDEFLEQDTTRLPFGLPSDALVNTTVTRLLLLGLGKEASRFRRWFLRHEREMDWSPARRRQEFLSERYLWEQVLEELLGRIPERDAEGALKALDALLLLYEKLRNEALSLDVEAIKKDRQSIGLIESSTYLPVVFDVSISIYYDALLRLLRQTFVGIQTAYQVVLDQAIADLGSGKGDKYLQIAKDRLESRLLGLLEPAKEKKTEKKAESDEEKKRRKLEEQRDREVFGQTVEVTRSEFKEGGGKHLDFFAKGKAARQRTVDVQFYDREMLPGLASEKELSFTRIFLVRRAQIQTLERIYGLEKDKEGKLTAETQENAAAIARLGTAGLRLESDDDWRRFLLAKFEEHKAKSNPTEALSAVVKLLELFLHTFTTHSPYNIDDFGDNLLTKEFPRALTGQLIQDCGVYALRIAYMLSLLRDHKDLQLRFRFIVLPVHVGLIITGQNLPLYIAHNDQISILSAEKVAEIRNAWIKTDEHGEPRTPTGKDEEDQFLAELAGGEFISGTDLPFQLLEAPKPTGGPEAIKREMWSFYTRRVAPVNLFGPEIRNPKSPLYQFDLKYLQILELSKAHYNAHLIPFWNDLAHPAWLKREPDLSKALARLKAAKGTDEQSTAQASYDELVKRYTEAVQPAFEVVNKRFEPVLGAQIEVLQILSAHPEALGKDVRRTHSARLEEVIQTPWWSRLFFEHLSDLTSRQEVWAPFAKPEDLLWPVD